MSILHRMAAQTVKRADGSSWQLSTDRLHCISKHINYILKSYISGGCIVFSMKMSAFSKVNLGLNHSASFYAAAWIQKLLGCDFISSKVTIFYFFENVSTDILINSSWLNFYLGVCCVLTHTYPSLRALYLNWSSTLVPRSRLSLFTFEMLIKSRMLVNWIKHQAPVETPCTELVTISTAHANKQFQ